MAQNPGSERWQPEHAKRSLFVASVMKQYNTVAMMESDSVVKAKAEIARELREIERLMRSSEGGRWKSALLKRVTRWRPTLRHAPFLEGWVGVIPPGYSTSAAVITPSI